MVAYAYAQAYRDAVSRLAIVDAPIPGTVVFERVRSNPRVWHFGLHTARDVPEALVAGRERLYLQAFFNARIFDPSAIEAEVPALVVVGSDDAYTTREDAERMRDLLGRSELVWLPGIGQMPNLEAPSAFNAALARLLNRVTADAPKAGSAASEESGRAKSAA